MRKSTRSQILTSSQWRSANLQKIFCVVTSSMAGQSSRIKRWKEWTSCGTISAQNNSIHSTSTNMKYIELHFCCLKLDFSWFHCFFKAQKVTRKAIMILNAVCVVHSYHGQIKCYGAHLYEWIHSPSCIEMEDRFSVVPKRLKD